MLSNWLKIAASNALNFWGNKTNRVTVQNISLATGEITQELIVPYGTWQFKILGFHSAANGKIFEVRIQGGTINWEASRGPGNSLSNFLIFEGVPYVEKSDRFKIKNISDVTITFSIVYNRIMKSNS